MNPVEIPFSPIHH